MIRPFRAETERYGHYSVAGEFVYDHPFQWGSEAHRPGPAARRRPLFRRVAPHPPEQSARRGAGIEHAGLSVAGAHAARRRRHLPAKMRALRAVGVPYSDEDIAGARRRSKGKTEQDAVIAYLQVLGTALRNVR